MIETNSRKIIKHLEQDGYVLVSVRRSHYKFEKEGMIIIVPHPKKDMPFGTARVVAKMAGWL